MLNEDQDIITAPMPSSVRLTVGQRNGTRQAGLTLKRQAQTLAGHIGAHQHEICPEALRTTKISAAGQTVCQAYPPR
jgi:hypothetical protein